MELSEVKKKYRADARARLEATSEEYRNSASVTIALNALALPEMKKATTVLLYCSVGKEPSTLALITKLIEAGKKVCLPRCTNFGADGSRVSDECTMEARRITTLDHLEAGAYGIPAPIAEDKVCPVVKPTRIDLIVLPCVACDANCNRLGHGAGYYDRYLEKVRGDCYKAALCYDSLIMEDIPMEDHDMVVNAVITEKAIYRWRPY